jgi:hypothetical protein
VPSAINIQYTWRASGERVCASQPPIENLTFKHPKHEEHKFGPSPCSTGCTPLNHLNYESLFYELLIGCASSTV